MSLLSCKGCNKNISSESEYCPQCGLKVFSLMKVLMYPPSWSILVVLLFIALVIAFWSQ